MSDESTVELHAVCQRCRAVVSVRRVGATWRMIAHKRWAGESWNHYETACPVKTVDAATGIAAWIRDMGDSANSKKAAATDSRDEAAAMIARADAADEAARELHVRIGRVMAEATPDVLALVNGVVTL